MIHLAKSNGFTARGLCHPATFLQQTFRRQESEEATVYPASESTAADPYNFVVDEFEMAPVTARTNVFATPRPVLFAEQRRQISKRKDKVIDKLLKAEVRKQDAEYRRKIEIKGNIFDDKSQSEDKGITDVAALSNDEALKDHLKIRLQTEFEIDKKRLSTSGKKQSPNKRSVNGYATERSAFRSKNVGQTGGENTYSKKFRLVTIDSKAKLRPVINTDRSHPITGESIDSPREKEVKVQLRKKFAGDVVGSLQSGQSLNLNKYVPRKTEPKATLELYLDVRSKESQIQSKAVRKNSRPNTLEIDSTLGKFQPSVTVSHLPASLRLGMKTFNDFYQPDRPESSRDDEIESRGHNDQLMTDNEQSHNPEKRQTLTYMIRAVKKVQQAASVVKAIREVEKARLRERVEARQAEMAKYNDVLNKLDAIVQEKEAEMSETERQARLKEAMESRKAKLLKREQEANKIEQRRLKELQSQLSPKLLDRYSAKKITGIKPYKSYWMKCIDTCLEMDNVFQGLPTKSELELNKNVDPDNKQSSTSKFDVGYFRVVLADKRKDGHYWGQEFQLFWEKYEEYTEYNFQISPLSYTFEFDDLLDLFETPESLQNSFPQSLTSLPSTALEPKKSQTSLNSKKKQKMLENFAKMFCHVDDDVKREYSLLYGDF